MSKFDGILSLKSHDGAKTKAKTPDSKKKAVVTAAESEPSADLPPRKKQAKRIGKRSDPDYTQITAYVRKNTHEEVMRKIYKRQEFSELLEELLSEWLGKTP